jgi:hypothetical protein
MVQSRSLNPLTDQANQNTLEKNGVRKIGSSQ